MKWKNTTNEDFLEVVRDEIRKSWRRTCEDNKDHPKAALLFDPDVLPTFYDPFAGGGTIPLEAQRLGLEAYASDLNPVAVLINKAMIEIPPQFSGKPPVNPVIRSGLASTDIQWKGVAGLAEDIRHYGKWIREEAQKHVQHLYPKIAVTNDLVEDRPDLQRYLGRELTVIAWLWARTVKSPNPAFADMDVPLAKSFLLSAKKGREAYVEPVAVGRNYRFKVKAGMPPDLDATKRGTKLSRGANFQCLLSGAPIVGDYIKAQGQAGRMSSRLMAIVAEGDRERIYISPTDEHESVVFQANPQWTPNQDLPNDPRAIWCTLYGLNTFADLFSPRQLAALTTFSDLLPAVRDRIRADAKSAGMIDDGVALRDGGTSITAYAEAVGVYLALAIDRVASTLCTIALWSQTRGQTVTAFARQAIPMTWDFPDVNPFAGAAGDYNVAVEGVVKGIIGSHGPKGIATQTDAVRQNIGVDKLVSTDPPYYDNIGYADLSDFFYVWLRPALRHTFPDLFATLATPKVEELVANPYRHGSKDEANEFFLNGMTLALQRLLEQTHPAFPVTIYYAFKQSESRTRDRITGTGWETFLEALISSGFAINGTWPIRTERPTGMKVAVNALASSIVLVCRPRPSEAPLATRREFIDVLRAELPSAMLKMQAGNIAPVDLAQAAIGPGMAVFTRFKKVLDASGEAMSVREALAIINQTLDEVLAEQEGDFDADTRWTLAWFEQSSFAAGDFGIAETLSKAKNISVSGLVEAGILESRGGKVRLLRPSELPEDWNPEKEGSSTVWEATHHLVRVLDKGEPAAAEMMAKIGTNAEAARELAYRLYRICDQKGRSQEALGYNSLVQSWPEISRLAQGIAQSPRQVSFIGDN